MAQLTTKRCSAGEIQAHVDELAALRIRVFRDFPYLYDGDLDYERAYLAGDLDPARRLEEEWRKQGRASPRLACNLWVAPQYSTVPLRL